jgi:uncharacterized protein involved in response to NO
MTNNLCVTTRTTERSSQRALQQGSITSMTLVWWTITVLSIVAISHTGRDLLSHQRTQHAADAVALAWVSRDSNAGQTVANAYDAIVTRVEDEGSRVRVWVTRGDHKASATAQYTQ